MNKIGRPSTYSEDKAAQICRRYAAGEHLTDICQEEGMPPLSTFHDWKKVRPELAAAFIAAQKSHADVVASQILDIVDNDPDSARARNRARLRWWLISKLHPQKYGDRHRAQGPVMVRVGTAILAAQARLGEMLEGESQLLSQVNLLDVADLKPLPLDLAPGTVQIPSDIFS